MSINRGMGKEDMAHIYNEVLLGHKKELNCTICRDVDGPRDHHTEWSRSKREKQILYINAYMWNPEKWYRRTYLQSRNRDTDVENKRMDTKGEREGGRNWEIGIGTYTLLILCIKWITNENILHSTGNLHDALWWSDWEGSPKGGDICVCMADPFCRTAKLTQHGKAAALQ